ncbi:putative epoxide hydrolase [Streptomyces sp. NBRC 110611]|uniref:haloacid dehalogenase type II n=1 Tax=Streptomyces sp. NBRC 110611 TaxID=1621259 RepID=UPI00082C171C|nr:haloacid dehalogenase type II [Streptomyces sp. NBRC 110611]GAU69285.1 putative epoxide hydrolase [Streptomyces sp. NBRC 110611]
MDIDAAVFDVFGTMTDWRSSVADALADIGDQAGLRADWPAVTDTWRRRYRPALTRVVTGQLPCMPLDDLHRLTLDEALVAHGLEALGEADRDALVGAWHRLRAWPDAAAGLERLHGSRVITATLSNGGVGLLTRLTKRTGLRFDCVLSAELATSYKPDPRVYLSAAELLRVEPQRLLMVACHADDLEAAAGAGLRTAYIPRPLEWGPEAAPVPAPAEVDLIAADVIDLARILTGAG